MPTGSWFYVDRGQQCGPVGTEELASWILGAHLPRDVQVWREGLAQWTAAETLPEIAYHLQPPAVGFFLMGPGGPQGPIDAPVIMEWARAGRIGRETLLWRDGLPQWITAGALPELAPYLAATANTYYTPTAPVAYAPAGDPAGGAAPFTAEEPRPVPDRDGPCPLCGDTTKMGPRARVLYEYWICRRCSNGMANRRQLAWLLDLVPLWGLVFVLGFTAAVVASAAPFDVQPIAAVLPWVACAVWLLKDGFDGHSPGKWLTGLQVVDTGTGRGAGLLASFKRNLPMLIPFAPLVAAMQLSRGTRLGDGWAHTRVVWKKHRGRGPF
jgi:uncharacterized protein DUF4339/RDD family protein